MKQVGSLRYEVLFKKAFCQPDIFTAFVKDFTGVQLEIDTVETEKTFDIRIGKVATRFDLFAEDKKNRVIVDIQHVRFPDHYDRFLHYHCAAILEQVASSETYTPALQVITLVVLTSGDKHQTDIAVIDFDPKDLQGKGLNELPHKVMYLCPPYVSEQTPEPYRQWLRAIQDTLDGEVDEISYSHPEIQKIFSLIEKDLISPQEYANMKDEYGYEQIGRDQYEKGVMEERRKWVQALSAQGMEIENIAAMLNVTTQEIMAVLEKNTHSLTTGGSPPATSLRGII